MPTLAQFHDFLKFLVDVFGALSSLLILFIAYLMHQLRCEQKENQELREKMLQALERDVEVNVQFVQAIAKLRTSVERALDKAIRVGRNGRP